MIGKILQIRNHSNHTTIVSLFNPQIFGELTGNLQFPIKFKLKYKLDSLKFDLNRNFAFQT